VNYKFFGNISINYGAYLSYLFNPAQNLLFLYCFKHIDKKMTPDLTDFFQKNLEA